MEEDQDAAMAVLVDVVVAVVVAASVYALIQSLVVVSDCKLCLVLAPF